MVDELLHERYWAQLVVACHGAGRRADALGAARRCAASSGWSWASSRAARSPRPRAAHHRRRRRPAGVASVPAGCWGAGGRRDPLLNRPPPPAHLVAAGRVAGPGPFPPSPSSPSTEPPRRAALPVSGGCGAAGPTRQPAAAIDRACVGEGGVASVTAGRHRQEQAGRGGHPRPCGPGRGGGGPASEAGGAPAFWP